MEEQRFIRWSLEKGMMVSRYLPNGFRGHYYVATIDDVSFDDTQLYFVVVYRQEPVELMDFDFDMSKRVKVFSEGYSTLGEAIQGLEHLELE